MAKRYPEAHKQKISNSIMEAGTLRRRFARSMASRGARYFCGASSIPQKEQDRSQESNI